MADLSSLIARLEKEKGPNREIDRDIALTVDGFVYEKRGEDAKPWFYHSTIGGRRQLISLYSSERLPAYTSSIDAAVALVQRVLPGWGGLLSLGSGNSIHVADLWSERRGNQSSEDEEEYPLPPGEDAQAEHASLPMAICLATLRALQQKGSSNG